MSFKDISVFNHPEQPLLTSAELFGEFVSHVQDEATELAYACSRFGKNGDLCSILREVQSIIGFLDSGYPDRLKLAGDIDDPELFRDVFTLAWSSALEDYNDRMFEIADSTNPAVDLVDRSLYKSDESTDRIIFAPAGTGKTTFVKRMQALYGVHSPWVDADDVIANSVGWPESPNWWMTMSPAEISEFVARVDDALTHFMRSNPDKILLFAPVLDRTTLMPLAIVVPNDEMLNAHLQIRTIAQGDPSSRWLGTYNYSNWVKDADENFPDTPRLSGLPGQLSPDVSSDVLTYYNDNGFLPDFSCNVHDLIGDADPGFQRLHPYNDYTARMNTSSISGVTYDPWIDRLKPVTAWFSVVDQNCFDSHYFEIGLITEHQAHVLRCASLVRPVQGRPEINSTLDPVLEIEEKWYDGSHAQTRTVALRKLVHLITNLTDDQINLIAKLDEGDKLEISVHKDETHSDTPQHEEDDTSVPTPVVSDLTPLHNPHATNSEVTVISGLYMSIGDTHGSK